MNGINSKLMSSVDGDNEYKNTDIDVDETYICIAKLKDDAKKGT